MVPETPRLTVDVLVRIRSGGRLRGLVLIERENPPHGLALPGGFVEVGETLEQAAVREVREEIGLGVSLDYLLGVYSDPGRDPRGHTVSAVFVGDGAGQPAAASDARRARVYPLEQLSLEDLVFDHARIVSDFLKGLRGVYREPGSSPEGPG